MDPTNQPPADFMTRAASQTWQEQLRESVRQLLSMGADPLLAQELDVLLQATEQQLLDYLLAGAPPTPLARQRAQDFLDMAQHQLLGSTLDVQQLLAELATTRTQEPPSALPS